ncbi:MAG: universal stress protein [Actinomycetaceae bacterium]|nr:universal stress protein [Actinomycetaceae bacterium]
MAGQKVILVGVDGSAEANMAVDWAAAHAKRDGSLVHVICTYALASYSAAALDGGYAALDDEALQKGAQKAVDDALDRLRGHGLTDITGSTEPGDAAGVLVQLSSEVDMIVVGSRGGGGFADRVLGTVSSALPAHAKCPVVVVPRHVSGSPFWPVKRIVAGVDGSRPAHSALEMAVEEALIWGAQVDAISAVPIATGAGMLSWVPTTIDREALYKEMEAELEEACEEVVAGRDVVVKRHVIDGSPAELLTEFSTAVDLVVVGARGRGGFAGLLLGSTSQVVLAHSTCPVMTVPSQRANEAPNPAAAWDRR